MTVPLPPTVAPRPPARPGPNPRKVAIGVVAIVATLAVGGYAAAFGIDQYRDRDDPEPSTTTTAPATAGLTDEPDATPEDPIVLQVVPTPARGTVEVRGYQAKVLTDEVEPTSWTVNIGLDRYSGQGEMGDAFGVNEQLLTSGDPIADAPIEAIARQIVTDDDGVGEVRETTVAGQPAWYGHLERLRDGVFNERFVVVFDGGQGPVIARLEAGGVTPESLQEEWLTFVSSVTATEGG